MQPNHDIDMLRRQWVVNDMPTDLADRIIARATALPQRGAFARWREGFLRGLTEWNYALPVKGALVAACLVIAVMANVGPATTVARGNAVAAKPVAPFTFDRYVDEMIWNETYY